jgi:hypothetical protein
MVVLPAGTFSLLSDLSNNVTLQGSNCTTPLNDAAPNVPPIWIPPNLPTKLTCANQPASVVPPQSDDLVNDIGCANYPSYLSSGGTAATSHGCLIISGGAPNTSAGTTLIVASHIPEISAGGTAICCIAHLEIENITFQKQQESSMTGSISAIGTTAIGTSPYGYGPVYCENSITKSQYACANLTLTLPSSNNNLPVTEPDSFASVANANSLANAKYKDNDLLVVQTGSYVSSSGSTIAFCSSPPTLVLGVTSQNSAPKTPFSANVTYNSSTGIYTIYTIKAVASYGSCSAGYAPNFGMPVAVTDSGNKNHPTGMMVFVAPTPSPLSLYNGMINNDAATNYVRAYTAGSSPGLAVSMVDQAGNCNQIGPHVISCEVTGCPTYVFELKFCTNQQIPLNFVDSLVPVPPVESTSNPLQWVVTLDRNSDGSPLNEAYKFMPLYMGQNGALTNVACMKEDEEQAVYVENQPNGYSEDVVFQNVAFLNHSRMSFVGILGANSNALQKIGENIYNPTASDKLLYPAVTGASGVPNQGVQLINVTISGTDPSICSQTTGGGAQISGWYQDSGFGPGPIWGNYVLNYSAASTADDSLALFSDIGGQTGTYSLNSTGIGITVTPTYPATVITNSSGVTPVISNSFQRFILIANVGADIDNALSVNAGLSTINGVNPSQANWAAFQGTVSTSVSAGISGCDTLALSGCPLQPSIVNPGAGPLDPNQGTYTLPNYSPY